MSKEAGIPGSLTMVSIIYIRQIGHSMKMSIREMVRPKQNINVVPIYAK